MRVISRSRRSRRKYIIMRMMFNEVTLVLNNHRRRARGGLSRAVNRRNKYIKRKTRVKHIPPNTTTLPRPSLDVYSLSAARHRRRIYRDGQNCRSDEINRRARGVCVLRTHAFQNRT